MHLDRPDNHFYKITKKNNEYLQNVTSCRF